MKISKYQKAVILRIIFVVSVAAMVGLILTSCTMVPKRTVSDPIQEVHDLVAQNINEARINAKEVIDAANEAGCDLAVVMYSEGKKDSKIMVQCSLGMPIPPPVKKLW